jgi:hypothetical protein
VTKIIILDDTVSGISAHFDQRLKPALDILRCVNDGSYSAYGRLYKNVSRAIEYALDNYDFEIALRIDDDALVIGEGFEAAALERFRSNSALGLLGSYKIDCMGNRRDFGPPGQVLKDELSWRGARVQPRRWLTLQRLVKLARKHGYEAGEHCLGAACFFSKQALQHIRSKGFLGRNDLATSQLCDDVILSLIIIASGYLIGDLAAPGLPLGLAWRGLPASPADLLSMQKKIVHSVRSFGTMDETAIRAQFWNLLNERT